MSELSQSAIEMVESWCTEMELRVNPSKTEIIVFSHRRRLNGLVIPKIFGQPVKLVNQVKHLGVILDNKLSWKPHLEHKLNKATCAFWQCRRAFGSNWGLSPKTLHYMYTAVIRPMFSYAAVVWWPRVKIQSCITRLNKLQRLACRAITGAMSTSPTLALETLLSLPPLDVFIVGVAISTAYRLNYQLSWIDTGKQVGHTKIWEMARSNIPQLAMINDYSAATETLSIPYAVSIPPIEWWNSEECIARLTDAIAFFSDGALSEMGGGYGVYAQKLNLQRNGFLGGNVTVFQSELLAVLHCLIEAQIANLVDENIIFCIDNIAVVKTLGKTFNKSKLAQECMG